MKKLFSRSALFYPYRWFILVAVLVAGLMLYYDLTGRRMFAFSDGKQWNSSGPGYHK